MTPLDPNVLPVEAWRPVEPVAGRSSNRISERELERIPAWISLPPGKSEGQPDEMRVTLYDYSTFGFAFLFNYTHAKPINLKEGDRVRVRLDIGGECLSANCTVKNTAIFKNNLRIGLSRKDLSRKVQGIPEVNVPQGEYLRIPEKVDIRAETANPILYGEWSSLRLSGLQPGLKLDFLCNDTAVPLFLGQRLDIHLALPSSGDNIYRGEIFALERMGGGTVRLRTKPVSMSSGLANDLAELLAFDAGISPDILKHFGFPIRFFRSRLTFRFVETMDDYAKVLHLRRNAYVEVGKRDEETTPEQMSIDWDKASRILCAFHEEVLVASAALTFPSTETAVLRSETAFPGNKFPGENPGKKELMEVNSLCTHKDYRRGDLLMAVFEHIARIFILSDRNYIMNLSETALLPIYLGIGFRNMRETGYFLGREHHLIKISRNVVIRGKGIGLLAWNTLYGDLMRDVLAKGMIPLDPWDRFIIKAKLSLGPVARYLVGRNHEKKFQRHIEEAKRND